MPKTEQFFGFSRKIFQCGVAVALISVLFLFANYFYFERTLNSNFGMVGLHDSRLPGSEVFHREQLIVNEASIVLYVGMIFALVGGALSLMYGFALKYLAPSFPQSAPA